MEDALVQCIELSLANCLTSNATFFAEQLVALSRPNGLDEPSEHSMHLLAMCYIQAGRHSVAFELLKDCNSPKNFYLRAVAAIALFRYTEAELALQPVDGINCDDDYRLVPNGAYGIYLLGVVKRRNGAPKLAAKYFKKSLELNPLLWCAYESLCQLGVPVDPSEYFGSEDPHMLMIQSIAHQEPVIEVTQTGKGPMKGIPRVSALASSERLAPERKAIATPALAKKMRVAMSPADEQLPRGSRGQSLARRLFETPRTPADSMLGISTSTPLWAPARGTKIGNGPIAMRMQVETPSTSISTDLRASLQSVSSSGAPMASSSHAMSTPARGAALTTPTPAKASAASPKKKTVSVVPSRSSTAKVTAKVTNAPAPTPRRAVPSTATTSTPATSISAKTTRVMPARAVKARGDKPSVSAANMTPIPSSLANMASSSANTTTPTTPPVISSAAPSKAIESKQPPPPRVRQAVTRPVSKKPALSSDDEDETIRNTSIPAFIISTTPIAPSQPSPSDNETLEDPSVESSPSHRHQESNSDVTRSESKFVIPTLSASVMTNSSGGSILPPFDDSHGIAEKASSSIGGAKRLNLLDSIPAGFSPASNASDDGDAPNNDEIETEDSWVKSMAALLSYLRQLGEATRLAEKFDCEQALVAFSKLSPLAKGSSYVMASIGKCYYEMADQERARDEFFMLRRRWPCSFHHMALYSNILWHLREKTDLSGLAHDLMKLDPRAVEAWCAMGNSFSLEKDVENALVALKRASQVNPGFAYTYTLAGHEYLAKDDLEQAAISFREALNIDPRHYRAWYGLGLAAYRQQKLSPALANFLKALEIFPKAAIICTSIGLCSAASEKIPSAINFFNKASAINPKSPHAKYHLASMFVSAAYLGADKAGFLIKAQNLFDDLCRIVPRSGALHLLKGRILKASGRTAEADEEFSVAKELDPGVANLFDDVIVVYDPPEIA